MDQSELDSLKADLRRMQARVAELETAGEQPTSRRNMLRGLGTAAAGAAVGGLAFARPAAAVDTTGLVIGDDTQTAQSTTGLITGTGSWTSHTNKAGFFVSDFVADADNANGIFATMGAYCDGATGADHSVAFFATSQANDGVGAFLDGEFPLKLTDFGGSGAPSASFGRTGFFKQDDGDLWFCTYDDGLFGGENPRWRKLAGPNSAGAFHAITPIRVYDSRNANPVGNVGILAANGTRTISVKDARNSSGVVIQTDAVPAGATAVAANVTITGTTGGGGYLSINPGGNTSQTTSSINWFGAGQNIANGLTLVLNTSRQVTAVCGAGSGNTHVIIDVSGYYI